MHKVKTGIQNKRLVIIIIIVIAAITYLSLRGCGKDSRLVYKFEKASIGEVKKTITTTGTLEVLDTHLVLSKIGGLVTNVYVDFNRNVKVNQLLAKLDTSEIDQQIYNIDSRRKSMTLDLLSAKRDLNSKKDMLKENLISERGVEQAELQYKKIETQLNQIQSEYEIARRNRNLTNIYSPCSGIIINMDIQPNIPIPSNKVVFVIAEDLRKMRLIIQVDESDIGSIKNDQKVTFTVSAFPDKTFEGKITQVRQNPVKTSIVSYPVLVACDNNELLLKPGMTATATVEVASKKSVLRVPNEALIVSPVEIENYNGKKYLWKKESVAMKSVPAKKIEVQTGLTGDYYTEVVSPKIKEGDEILTAINKSTDVKESLRQ